MPKNKDLKRLTRSRMAKTGESYTAARQRLLDKKLTGSDLTDAELASKAGMSNEAVQAKTGRNWRQWVELLDDMGAMTLPHRDVVMKLYRELEIPAWWTQTVTVGYERVRGLREIGQRRSGSYEIGKSKTIAVPIAQLYAAFVETAGRQRWLPDVEWTVRKATANKSLRITWADETLVDVHFTAKSKTKSLVSVRHRKLATRERADELRGYWAERLTVLADTLLE